jgi:dihydroxy-acid dehydratase
MTDRTAGLEHGLTDYGDRDFSSYLRRSFAQSMGYSRDMLAKPVIGIAYTGSDFNNCHRHFPELLAAVKRACSPPAHCRSNFRRFRSARFSSRRPV